MTKLIAALALGAMLIGTAVTTKLAVTPTAACVFTGYPSRLAEACENARETGPANPFAK